MRETARRIGYARVSTEDQNLSLQIDALSAAGCDLIFRDEGVSGTTVARPALTEALSVLNSGDMLVTWRLDRLGRNLTRLLAVVAELRTRGVGFRSLTETIDTTSAGGRFAFHLTCALAELERDLISERTRAGMASAKARGAVLGRPLKLTTAQVLRARAKIEAGAGTPCEIAGEMGVSALTLARALRRLEPAG